MVVLKRKLDRPLGVPDSTRCVTPDQSLIPPAAVIQRDKETSSPVQRLQHALAATLPGDGITQRTAQPAQDGRLQQEGLDTIGLTRQHLLGQVIDHVAVITRETGNEGGHVVSALHRQRRQLKRGDPALGAPLQCRHVLRRQLQPWVIVVT